MKNYIIITYLLLCTWPLYAQHDTKVDLSQRLAIGADLPDMPAMEVLNFEDGTVDLDDYRDKVVILDFWDTYCATCIELMPHVKEVQKTVGEKAQIFTVTWQSRETIEKFFANNRYLKEKNAYLPTIVSDKLLKGYFPHRGVPHTIFIYKGKVKAITQFDYIRPEYIDRLIQTGSLDIPVKDDFNTMTVIQEKGDLNLKGKVLVTGYQEGLTPKGGFPTVKDTTSGMYVTSITNFGKLDAFIMLFTEIAPTSFLWVPGRIEWHVQDPDTYAYKENTIGPTIWQTKYAICYQRFSQDTLPKREMARLAVADLSFFLGVNVTQEKKEKDVLIIQKTDRPRVGAVKPVSGARIEGADNLTFILDYSKKYPPAVDESGFMEVIDIPDYSSLATLNQHLLYYGLEAVLGRRTIDVMVIRETR